MGGTMDTWNPNQYEKFKEQRAKPFYDLLALCKEVDKSTVIDLGCGTGELTQKLHKQLKPSSTLGIDSSENMLNQSKPFQSESLHFKKADIKDFDPLLSYDIVFSNAALQWVDNHETLFPKIFSWVKRKGQIAIQMPYNFDHASHQIASEVAFKLFPSIFPKTSIRANVLGLERYAELLFQKGFHEQECKIRVYGHPMPSGYSVVEWTKGTLLTSYQNKLTPTEFEKFLKEYTQELIRNIGDGPYFYGFKRMLLWGRKDD
jgi:trans-aconitate 2-methyltransferase